MNLSSSSFSSFCSFSSLNQRNHLLKPPRTVLLFQNTFQLQIRQFRFFKRRRIKRKQTIPKLTVFNQLGPSSSSFENLFQNLIEQFPSVNSIDLLAPALGFFSGAAVYFSSQCKLTPFSPPRSATCEIGEWILFTSPTPFNRFVLLRCPSISFEGSELLEDVNEKLVKEDRHFVKLNNGKIQVRENSGGGFGLEEKLEYQRVCVSAEDGGVISLDWPANLDLHEEHGLDTTLLLVPGTAEGSMDKNVRLFVCEALIRGFFPVVMNPRGCAGSPLTTARLFTAADSDDISTAVQFINKARPWTTLMGVGWGYGANMLTKYLAEVGERTPLTAATCIDNPFDLEEATRSSPHQIALDKKLAGGLIGILRSNKELFKGRAKGFDVEKALLAKSVRDFEKAISMVSYGFNAIEDFYSKSSTRDLVGNVKIPMLFIQNDDGTVPLFSVPRSLIAQNPYTSLLLCSCLPSDVIGSGRAAASWCHHLTIEWLTAVELGLLKGRHPLLEDVDVTINPLNGFALAEGMESARGEKNNKLLDLTFSNASNNYSIDPIKEMLEDRDDFAGINLTNVQDSVNNWTIEVKGLQELEVDNLVLQQTSSADTELVKEGEALPLDSENGQVLQTAQVVMNMLDVTMPGTLSEEEKNKVLTAVGQGETLVKALENAVPEDVRGKLTTAVAGILHAQRTNLKLDKLMGIGKIPDLSAGSKIENQEKVRGQSSNEGLYKDLHCSDQIKRADDSADNIQSGMDRPPSELHLSENSQRSHDMIQSQSSGSAQEDVSSSVRKGTNDTGNNHESDELLKEKVVPHSDHVEKGLETSAKTNSTGRAEKVGGTGEVQERKGDQDGGPARLEMKEENNTLKNEEKPQDSLNDQNKMTSPGVTEQAVSLPGSSTEPHLTESEGNDNQKSENKNLQPVIDQNKPVASDTNTPTFSVSQALDALTGMDDSTQVAVNSVFGVIENMISQLEEKENVENEAEGRDKVADEQIHTASEKQCIDDCMLEENSVKKEHLGVQSETVNENSMDLQDYSRTGLIEEEFSQSPISSEGHGTDASQGTNTGNQLGVNRKKEDHLVGRELLANYSNRPSHVNSIPSYVVASPYGDIMHNDHFRQYLVSKIPSTKPLDVDSTTALLLDYFPEEGQWKLLEQPDSIGESNGDVTRHKGISREVEANSPAKVSDIDNFIEPSYVILDTEKQHEPAREYDVVSNINENAKNGDDRSEELMHFVKKIIFDSLRVEVDRRLNASGKKKIESIIYRDMEQVAKAVSLAVCCSKEHTWHLKVKHSSINSISEKVGTLYGGKIIKAISSAIQGTSYLRRVLPVGVIVGSCLAALRKYFDVSTVHEGSQREGTTLDQIKKFGENNHNKTSARKADQLHKNKAEKTLSISLNSSVSKEEDKLKNFKNDSVMVGAVTAALGASAFLVQQQDANNGQETAESTMKPFKEKHHKEPHKLDEIMAEKSQNNIVTSIAEKAMSVAAPVVPTKEDGEVDQERLVAMLADLGQRGGMLRLVGKIALLWGGLRGAVSLTDRLISFLHIAERPLLQRILGFSSMVLVLWSPVVVPLLPTLMQGWTTNSPSKFAELVCIGGLYTAIMILVTLWGKRIRGHEYPLQQYGLNLSPFPKVQSILKGLIGGVLLVLFIESVNVLLGCVSLSWPSSHPASSFGAMAWLKVSGKIFMLASREIITATGVALVEELLFRSWLPEEIAADLGYHQGIIISGLAFSLSQRSPWAIPGLWLLSLALTGARERSQGSLMIPIGLRAGILASSFVLHRAGFVTYKPGFPLWVAGTNPLQPFSGVVGFGCSLLLAMILYPRRQPQKRRN